MTINPHKLTRLKKKKMKQEPLLISFLNETHKTDLESQINFIEFINNTFRTPLFMATLQSLKELQSIKRKKS